MQLTSEETTEIENFAEVLFTPNQIALVMNFDIKIIKSEMNDENSPFARAFYRGRLKTIAATTKVAIDWAKRGSTPAITQVLKLIEESNLKIKMKK